MKKFLFPLFLTLFVTHYESAYAQNAFYDAKLFAANHDNPEFPKKAIGLLLSYANEPYDSFCNHYSHFACINDFIKKYNESNKYLFAQLIDNPVQMKSFISKIHHPDNKLMQIVNLLNKYGKLQMKAESLRATINELEEDVNDKASIIAESIDTDQPVDSSAIISAKDNLIEKRKRLKELKTEISDLKSRLLKSVDESLLQQLFNNTDQLDEIKKKIQNDIAEKERMSYEVNLQTAAKSANALKINVPTQSEMIDAMAIYLAKRVKQEVAIAFVEKLALYINEQEILKNLFPATLTMLNNRDAFAKPNFGAAWQLSLYEDFIKMPENIVKCLPKQYNTAGEYLQDGIKIGRLVQNHYSFLEAVNHFHAEPFQTPELNKANTVMYIINNDFFDTSKNEQYWINAQQLQQLEGEQRKWLILLLDIKYKSVLKEIFGDKWSEWLSCENDALASKSSNFMNWVAKILVQLNHLESAINKTDNDKKGERAKEILSGFWKFQDDLFGILLDDHIIELDEKARKGVEFTRSIFKLYSGIDTKNYSMIVEQLFKIFDLMELNKKIDVKNILFNNKFSAALKQKDAKTQSLIKNAINELNDHYFETAHKATLADLVKGLLAKIDSLDKPEKISLLNTLSMDDHFTSKLVESLKESDMPLTKEFPFTEEMLNHVKNGTHADIYPLLISINEKYKRLHQGNLTFFTLQKLIEENDLFNAGFLQINKNEIETFVTDKLFGKNAAIYFDALNRFESRSAYQKIRTTMSFLSDVLQSDNSTDLSKVVESYSLPVSSYKLKRNSKVAITFDALVGVYFGAEMLNKQTAGSPLQAVWGISAPMGISISRGSRCKLTPEHCEKLSEGEFGFVNRRGDLKKMTGNNFTVMLSVVDIGAAVSYRITNDGEDGFPKDAKWSQFIAPGLTLMKGIRGLPLCIGTGARFTPKLRTFSTGEQRNALRWDVGLYFDLPLMNVYYKK